LNALKKEAAKKKLQQQLQLKSLNEKYNRGRNNAEEEYGGIRHSINSPLHSLNDAYKGNELNK